MYGETSTEREGECANSTRVGQRPPNGKFASKQFGQKSFQCCCTEPVRPLLVEGWVESSPWLIFGIA